MATIEKSISNMYRNYKKVCEKLDKSAHCSQKCSLQDQSAFFQYTTFYRIHCIDFEEELESVLPCLREAAYKADIGIYCFRNLFYQKLKYNTYRIFPNKAPLPNTAPVWRTYSPMGLYLEKVHSLN